MTNPMKLLHFKSELHAFEQRHTKFIRYIDRVQKLAVKDSVVDMTVTDPEGKSLRANIRLTEEDVQMLAELKEFLGKG